MSLAYFLLVLALAIVLEFSLNVLTSISGWLVGRAARILPDKCRVRFEDEWMGTLLHLPRLRRIFFALDLFEAARRIRRDSKSR